LEKNMDIMRIEQSILARQKMAIGAYIASIAIAITAVGQQQQPGHRALPRWSWDTVQTFMHCANVTGEWNDKALSAMARMSYVTFESGHKMYADPIMDQEEAKITESCRLVKLRSNNQTTCLMYTEADWARRTYSLGHALDAEPSEELHCGGVLQSWPHYQQSIDPLTGKWWNYTAHAYDYGNAAGAEKWIQRATNTVATGWVDGIYLDGLPYPEWKPPTLNCSKAEVAQYAAGMNQTVRELARRLGPEGIIIANGIVTPEYKSIATGWMDDQVHLCNLTSHRALPLPPHRSTFLAPSFPRTIDPSRYLTCRPALTCGCDASSRWAPCPALVPSR
jgi:hypothetical protein